MELRASQRLLHYEGGSNQAKEQGFLSCLFAIAYSERLIDAHRLVADRRDRKAHFSGELVVGLALDHAAQDLDLAGG